MTIYHSHDLTFHTRTFSKSAYVRYFPSLIAHPLLSPVSFSPICPAGGHLKLDNGRVFGSTGDIIDIQVSQYVF